MRYEGNIYRPPSEANSLLIQVTNGCSHNQCTFCNMFKDVAFKIRKIEDVFEDLEMARDGYSHVKRIFLIDGDALVLKTSHLKQILTKIKELFPECERVGLSSTTMDILRKSDEDLIILKNLGLKIIYLGVETGSDLLLEKISKGVTSDEIVIAGKKVMASGIQLSVSVISGLGGEEHWEIHATETAEVLNNINPTYIGLLTLVVEKGSDIEQQVNNGTMTLLTPLRVMMETKKLIEHTKLTHSLFRGNHASNYVPFSATLGAQKEQLLEQINHVIECNRTFKSDENRRV